ncbi:MAG: germination protein YpeB [Oscillospiraceae bacterium]|jgi:germination protein YpeB|nr:germination protein YpeB [Oscillospiraceae bacterium]
MQKRRIAIACYGVAAAVILGGFIYKNHLTAEFYRRQVVNGYRHAFNEVVAEVAELDSALQKCVFSGTPGMETETFMGVYGASMSAKQALGELPNRDDGFQQTSGFIAKVGDYAFSLSKKTARGEELTEEEKENVRKLSDAASVLSGNLTGVLSEVNDGSLTLEELGEIERRASKRGDAATGAFSERIKVAEDEFPEMPTLIYDGPFSSHIEGMMPKFLEGKAEVSQEDARKAAADFLGFDNLSYDGERAGNLPVYIFSLPLYGGTSSVEVSKRGGEIVNVYSSRISGDPTITADEAVEIAKKFLADRGLTSLAESYRMSQNNTVTVNFAHTQGGVICYTDLIKVSVARDTGNVVGYEAQGYVMHHREREIPEPQVSEEDAQAKVSKRLKVLSTGLAIIPTDGRNEVFTREFKCEAEDGRHYIVYINAETGREERVIILVESENGTLAM